MGSVGLSARELIVTSTSHFRHHMKMAQRKAKRAKQDPAMLLDEELILICDWEVCRQLFQNMDRFLEHVAQHAGQVGVTKLPSLVCGKIVDL